jgi:arginyl-tRNA synthetase
LFRRGERHGAEHGITDRSSNRRYCLHGRADRRHGGQSRAGEDEKQSGQGSDHEPVNKQVLALLDKLKVEPEDNDTSKSLVDAASKKQAELLQLSGAAFDKAYVENEVAYHQNVSEALEKTLIPDAQNSQLKQLLETGLKLFKEHQKHAEHLVQELK